MAKFRCKRSGNTVSFTNLNDIEGMRNHEGYEEVIETVAAEVPSFLSPVVQEVPKKRGRQKREV